jgi:hypothetical protein
MQIDIVLRNEIGLYYKIESRIKLKIQINWGRGKRVRLESHWMKELKLNTTDQKS